MDTGILTAGTNAQSEEQLALTSYYFSDSGGNSVTTTALNLAKRIFDRTVLLFDLELDNVFVPPVDGVTGATRPTRQKNEPFEKTRRQLIVGVDQGFDNNTRVSLNAYHSSEKDYRSNSLIGAYTREMFQRNTVLLIRGQFIDDQVGKILDSGDIESRSKWWALGKVGLGQVLSPTSVLDINYDVVFQRGFLSDPYRQVQVFNALNAYDMVAEKHPGQRLRQALTGKLSHYLVPVGASFSGSYRLYLDSWSLRSHTVELQFNKYVLADLILRVNYRFYTQSEAEFSRERYSDSVVLNDAFRTGDYKLQAFQSNNFGLSLNYLLANLAVSRGALQFLEKSSVEMRYFRYFNTLGFSADIFQFNFNLGL